ncbi:FkbM family methyltransferase [Saccharospirillum impatiens]|uniref:FkbM family methyltransferase n=1 Tax=Saccharospirillum impatiens TaxID=169438 RepID=UPI00040D4CB5|nr:FkbM family methyltransferase [Saccharospirillum impatiens]
MAHIGWRERLGLWRSLLMYYGIPGRQSRMRRCYGQFIRSGDLCFEIGAHVGNRVLAWRTLGAKVVAVEPQPLLMQTLRNRYGQDPGVTLVEEALGAEPGEATLFISTRTPTVTTLSRDWISQVQQDPSFQSVQWDRDVTVPVTTLDALIEAHGEPRFCKIDVEGFELAVLQGLSRPIAALSFEYIPASIGTALGCIERLEALSHYEYNLAPGETHRLSFERWLAPGEMARVLESTREGSGDVYARRLTPAR